MANAPLHPSCASVNLSDLRTGWLDTSSNVTCFLNMLFPQLIVRPEDLVKFDPTLSE